jgi:hypothetical protein
VDKNHKPLLDVKLHQIRVKEWLIKYINLFHQEKNVWRIYVERVKQNLNCRCFEKHYRRWNRSPLDWWWDKFVLCSYQYSQFKITYRSRYSIAVNFWLKVSLYRF